MARWLSARSGRPRPPAVARLAAGPRMGKTEALMGERQSAQRDAEPQRAICEQRTLQPHQECVIFGGSPRLRQLAEHGDAKGVQQPRETPPPQRPGDELPTEIRVEEEESAAEVGRDRI